MCEDLEDDIRSKYTVLVLSDHDIVRRFIKIYNDADYLPEERNVWYFSAEGKYLIVYPYVRPRPLSSFYMGKAMSLSESEEICKNIIVCCMTSGLPWPVLYEVLRQGQVNLATDKSISFSYGIDLSALDEEKSESDCVVECAKLLLFVLGRRTSKSASSYVLLQKKIDRESYSRFIELYRDLDIAGVSNTKKGIFVMIHAWFIRNRDTLFRILLAVSMILLVFTLVTLITNAIFGDVPWLRLFTRSFEKIGLETLTN